MDTEAPSWAKSHDVAFLKSLAAIFKREFKPHTHGAFGIPNERDIASALSANQCAYTKRAHDTTNEIKGVAMYSVSRALRKREDFAGRRCHILPGDLLVSDIAGEPVSKIHLLTTLMAGVKAQATWVCAHVENKQTGQLLSELGFQYCMTRISAASDLIGIYVLGNTAGRLPPAMERADEPGAKVLLYQFLSVRERDAIIGEAVAYAESHQIWAQHYSTYNKRHSWTAFAICGYAKDDPLFIIKPDEMSRKWKVENPSRMSASCGPTTAASAFPSVYAVLKKLPSHDFQRVRLMRLSPGGELTRHSDITDPEAGTADGKICRLHIPLTTSPQCLFRSWNVAGAERRIHFAERALCYLDTRKPHAVINPAKEERIHLVIDAFANSELRAALAA